MSFPTSSRQANVPPLSDSSGPDVPHDQFGRFIPGYQPTPMFPILSSLSEKQHRCILRRINNKWTQVQPFKYEVATKQDFINYEKFKNLYAEERFKFRNWAKLRWISRDYVRALYPHPVLEDIYDAEFSMREKEIRTLPQRYMVADQINLKLQDASVFGIKEIADLKNVNVETLPQIKYPTEIKKPLRILMPSSPIPKPCNEPLQNYVLPTDDSVGDLSMPGVHLALAKYALNNGCRVIASEAAINCILETDRRWNIVASVISVPNPVTGRQELVLVLGNEFSIQKECSTRRMYRAFKQLLYRKLVPKLFNTGAHGSSLSGEPSESDQCVETSKSDDSDFWRPRSQPGYQNLPETHDIPRPRWSTCSTGSEDLMRDNPGSSTQVRNTKNLPQSNSNPGPSTRVNGTNLPKKNNHPGPSTRVLRSGFKNLPTGSNNTGTSTRGISKNMPKKKNNPGPSTRVLRSAFKNLPTGRNNPGTSMRVISKNLPKKKNNPGPSTRVLRSASKNLPIDKNNPGPSTHSLRSAGPNLRTGDSQEPNLTNRKPPKKNVKRNNPTAKAKRNTKKSKRHINRSRREVNSRHDCDLDYDVESLIKSCKKLQICPDNDEKLDFLVHYSRIARVGNRDVLLEPIVELQPELGGSNLNESKIKAITMSMILRPSAILFKTHLSYKDGEVIIMEQRDKDVLAKVYGDKKSEIAKSLYTVFNKLRKMPAAQYLLIHEARHLHTAALFSDYGMEFASHNDWHSFRIYGVGDPNLTPRQEIARAKLPPKLNSVLLPIHKTRYMAPLAFSPYPFHVEYNEETAQELEDRQAEFSERRSSPATPYIHGTDESKLKARMVRLMRELRHLH